MAPWAKQGPKKILLIGVLSVIVGGLYVYPDIRFIYELGGDYAGIHLMGAPDETLYLTRIRGVYKGDYRLANVGIYEHRDDPYLLPPVAEVIEGSIGKALGLTISQLDILFTFLMPALLFLLVFYLAFRLSNRSRTAIIASLSVLLGYHLFTPSLVVLKKVFLEGSPLVYVRPISPQFHFIPFLLALLLVYESLKIGRSWKTLSAGVSVGSLFYFNVIYYWSFVFAGLGVFLVISLVKGRRDLARTIVAIFGISLFLSVPYWVESLSAHSSPYIGDMLDRQGLEKTRQPILPVFQVLLSVLVIFLYRPKGDVRYWFITSFLVGGLICLNQQVLTSVTVQSFHWQSYTNKPFIILALILTAPTVISVGSPRVRSGIFYGAMFVLITMAAVQQNSYYMKEASTYRNLQPLAKPLQWLVTNTHKDDVVLVDPVNYTVADYVSTYTNNYVYVSNTHLFASLVSREELEERYLLALRFYGYSLEEAEVFFREVGGEWSSPGRYGLWGQSRQIEQHLGRLRDKYTVFLQNSRVDLTNYRVDYVLVSGSKDPPFLTRETNRSLRAVYDDGLFRIFRLIRDIR